MPLQQTDVIAATNVERATGSKVLPKLVVSDFLNNYIVPLILDAKFVEAARYLNQLHDDKKGIRHRSKKADTASSSSGGSSAAGGDVDATAVIRDATLMVDNPKPDLKIMECQQILMTLAGAKLLLTDASNDGDNPDDLYLNFLASTAFRLLLTQNSDPMPGEVAANLNEYLITHLCLRLNVKRQQAIQRLLVARDFAAMQQLPQTIATRYDIYCSNAHYAVVETVRFIQPQLDQTYQEQLDKIAQNRSPLPSWFVQLTTWQQALVKQLIPQLKLGVPIPPSLQSLLPPEAIVNSYQKVLSVYKRDNSGASVADLQGEKYSAAPLFTETVTQPTTLLDEFKTTAEKLHEAVVGKSKNFSEAEKHPSWTYQQGSFTTAVAKSSHAFMAAAYGHGTTRDFGTSALEVKSLPVNYQPYAKQYFATPLARFAKVISTYFASSNTTQLMIKFDIEWNEASSEQDAATRLRQQQELIKRYLSQRMLRTEEKSQHWFKKREASLEKVHLLQQAHQLVGQQHTEADLKQLILDLRVAQHNVSRQLWVRDGTTGTVLKYMSRTVLGDDNKNAQARDFGRHYSYHLQTKAFKTTFKSDNKPDFAATREAVKRLVAAFTDGTWAKASYWTKHNTDTDKQIKVILSHLLTSLGSARDVAALQQALGQAYRDLTTELSNTNISKHSVGKLFKLIEKHLNFDLQVTARALNRAAVAAR